MTKICVSRRRVMEIAACATTCVAIPGSANALGVQTSGAQTDDFLVAVGDSGHTALRPRDFRRGAAPVLAWPMDPKTGHVRDGAIFNQLLLLRLFGDRDEAHGGSLVAFSAVCTHAGCIVSSWRPATARLLCPCHGSEYDPARSAAVVAGPAPMPLPSLPLAVTGGLVVVAGSFSAPLGGHTGRTD